MDISFETLNRTQRNGILKHYTQKKKILKVKNSSLELEKI